MSKSKNDQNKITLDQAINWTLLIAILAIMIYILYKKMYVDTQIIEVCNGMTNNPFNINITG